MKDSYAKLKLSVARAQLEMHLQAIAGHFTETPMITLIIRQPQLEDGDLILTNDDDLDLTIAAINKLRDRDPQPPEVPL